MSQFWGSVHLRNSGGTLLCGLVLSAAALSPQETASIGIAPGSGVDVQTSVEGPQRYGPTTGLVRALAYAFEIDARRIDALEWMEKAPFDIHAQAGAGEDVRPLLREALVAKFQIVWHKETRLADVWVMSLPGPAPARLQPSTKPATAGNGLSLGEVVADLNCAPCEFESIAPMLARALDAPLIDETGLGGAYEFSLSWRRDDPGSLAAAWQEAAGVALIREARPAEFLVIDAATNPFAPPEQPRAWACEAAPAVRAALDALPRMDADARWALARKYPRDVFVQMRVQDALGGKPSPEWDRARALYRELNDPVLGPFLEARLTRSDSLLAGVLKRAPEFPWAHLAAVEGTEAPGRRDVRRAETHMREFRRLCPESLAALAHYGNVEDPVMLEQAAEAAARLLAGRVDEEAFAAWPAYWDLRLRIARSEDRAALRARIRADLNRLRLYHRPASTAWAAALRHGFRLLGDEAGEAWLDGLTSARPKT